MFLSDLYGIEISVFYFVFIIVSKINTLVIEFIIKHSYYCYGKSIILYVVNIIRPL